MEISDICLDLGKGSCSSSGVLLLIDVLLEKKDRLVIFLREFVDFLVALSNLASTALSAWLEIFPS